MSSKDAKLSKLELQIMRAFWKLGAATLRQAYEAIPASEKRPEYTTTQTIVTRLEAKGAILRSKKIGNAWVYEPQVTRQSVVGKLVDDLFGLLDGAASPIVSHLAESGKLSEDDIREIERIIDESKKKEPRK
ncbi:BlaI/MecI/CopY family transcriptional regulator [Pelagicoccus sp. SDUM812003]|uniref:BlaI/MecI/CopY family transcriptional regulator n=1 Tax=Pelagicoccus sp. SDUM812003 TaxID=3041267 RepID=UPI00280DD771|nr:BlaI/MecI/CopY family transcriptional regulator [Pelagicoccus sp. SDUM812003]MDQ8204280.1 BlaI/MecI/CopY family transcriptional regulator [Pelagicoccus sp. SDUM812003]